MRKVEKNMTQEICCYDPTKDKDVKAGLFNLETHTFIRRASRKRHLCKKYGCYGMQKTLLRKLKQKETWVIITFEIETQKVYVSLLEDWFIFAEEDNLGNGPQLFLKFRYQQICETKKKK